MTRQPGLPEYEPLGDFPDLVAGAVRASRTVGFDKACLPEVGRLLHLLAASRTGIRIGETGTACGVGTAWLASAMDTASRLVTVEADPERAAIAKDLFGPVENVEVLTGDWSLLKGKAPFDVLFIDGGPAKHECDEILSMASPRGIVLFDDFTPPERWTAEQREAYLDGDPVREAWRRRDDCMVTEVRVTDDAAVLLVARVASRGGLAPDRGRLR
ncbi:MAG: O-methyltransferase [Candidatus Limnocylindria bacterium]